MPVELLTVRASMIDELSAKTARIRGEVKGLEADMARLSTTSVAKAGPGLETVERRGLSLGSMATDLRGRLGRLSDSMWDVAERGAKKMVIGLGVLGLATTGFGLKAASNFEQTRIALDGFLGSAEAGGRMFAELQQLNLKTPFQLNEISQGARQLLAFQINGEKVVPLMKSITDIASGTGNPEALGRIILNLGQIQSIGKVTGRDLRDLATVGFPGYALVANILGKSKEDVQKLGDQATVTSDQFINAVLKMQGPLGMFSGMAEKQQTSLKGMWSNVMDVLNIRLADASGPLVSALKVGMPQLTSTLGGVIDTVAPPLIGFITTLLSFVQKLLPVVGPVLGAVATGLGKILERAGPAIAQLAPRIPEIADAFGRLVIAVLPLVAPLGELLLAMAPLAITTLDLATTLTIALLPVIVPLINGLAGLIERSEGFRYVIAGVLFALLGFRAINGVISIVENMARAVGLLAARTEGLAVAETNEARARGLGGLGAGGTGRIGTVGAGLAGVTGVGLAAQGVLGNKGRPTLGGDLETVGGFALAGGALGSIIPGAGTVAGGIIGAGVGGVAVGIHHLFGRHEPAKATVPSSPAEQPITVTVPVVASTRMTAADFADPAFQAHMDKAMADYQADREARGH